MVVRWLVCLIIFIHVLSSCSTTRQKPCSEGGQPARESTAPFKGTKKCYQEMDKAGVYLNHGRYYEWHENEKIAIIGEYKMGKKVGRWIEYNEKGEKIADKYFNEGKEVSAP